MLTSHRLLDIGPIEAGEAPQGQSWPLDAASGLCGRSKARRAAGTARPRGTTVPLCYTTGRSPQAHRLAQRFERLRQGELSGGDETGDVPTTVCPSCGAILAASQITCPDCGVVKDKPGPARIDWRVSPRRTSGWFCLGLR